MKTRFLFQFLAALVLALSLRAGTSLAQEGAAQDVAAALLTAGAGADFTYQGRLTDGGNPANGAYDFQFLLFDAAGGGSQVGGALTVGDIAVSNGLFTTQLDFGATAFQGAARWLEIRVRPGASSGAYTTLSPRQALTAAPYALSLRPEAVVNGSSGTILTLAGGTIGLAADGDIYGVYGQSDSTAGVGAAGRVTAASGSTYGVLGQSDSPDGRGVYGMAVADSGAAYGVYGLSSSTDGRAVYGFANAVSGATYGVYGQSNSTSGRAVYGFANAVSGATYGVYGESASTAGTGVIGRATAASGNTVGVYGKSDSPSGYAGYFNGKVHVAGTLSKAAGSFKIDHPLDPANQYLSHSFVESPDMKNIYDGVAVLDDSGAVWVELPAYFGALNRDFRYQLTPVGASMPGLYIAQEIQDNRFQIAGGEPGKKVSWQVTGIRQDAYANAHRIPVEEPKPEGERGLYLHPAELGQPEELSLDYQRGARFDDVGEVAPPSVAASE